MFRERSDGVNEFLKIILLAVIGIALVGVLFWFISDKYPIYAAKKEVQLAIKEIGNAYQRWAPSSDDPVTIDYIFQKNWVILSKETRQHWNFELIGDPAHTVRAQSTAAMPGGRDKYVFLTLETGEIKGWGIPGSEDSVRTQ